MKFSVHRLDATHKKLMPQLGHPRQKHPDTPLSATGNICALHHEALLCEINLLCLIIVIQSPVSVKHEGQ